MHVSAFGEVDGGHASGAEFPLDGIAVGEGGFEAGELVGHGERKLRAADALRERIHPR